MSWVLAFSDTSWKYDEAPPPFPSRFVTVECRVLPLWLLLVYNGGFVVLSAKKDGGQLQSPRAIRCPATFGGGGPLEW